MHYNIQIHIQQVQEPEPINDPVRGRSPSHTERKVTSILELKVTADTESAAYERALRVLSMNAPEPQSRYIVTQETESEEKLRRLGL